MSTTSRRVGLGSSCRCEMLAPLAAISPAICSRPRLFASANGTTALPSRDRSFHLGEKSNPVWISAARGIETTRANRLGEWPFIRFIGFACFARRGVNRPCGADSLCPPGPIRSVREQHEARPVGSPRVGVARDGQQL